jgi:formiminotetrahydrofolate cyclodeaminase
VNEKQREKDYLSLSVRGFISAAGAKQPTPGGGSVAGVVAALGVALGEMALNYTQGKKQFAQDEDFYAGAGKHFERARAMFDALANDDVRAYELYTDASKMPKGPEREEALQLALAAAIDVPREMAKLALAVLTDLEGLSQKCNPRLISDVKAAGALSVAAIKMCHYNVQINIPEFADKESGQEVLTASQSDLGRAEQILSNIENE